MPDCVLHKRNGQHIAQIMLRDIRVRFTNDDVRSGVQEDGSVIFEGLASSTGVDSHGTRFELQSLEQMRDQFIAGVNYFGTHSLAMMGDFVERIGKTVNARIVPMEVPTANNGGQQYGLLVTVRIFPSAIQSNDSAKALVGQLLDDQGQDIGQSVGVIVLRSRDEFDAEGNLTAVVFEDVILDHLVPTLSPSNRESMTLQLRHMSASPVIPTPAEPSVVAPISPASSGPTTPRSNPMADETPLDESSDTQDINTQLLGAITALGGAVAGIGERLDALESAKAEPEAEVETEVADEEVADADPIDAPAADELDVEPIAEVEVETEEVIAEEPEPEEDAAMSANDELMEELRAMRAELAEMRKPKAKPAQRSARRPVAQPAQRRKAFDFNLVDAWRSASDDEVTDASVELRTALKAAGGVHAEFGRVMESPTATKLRAARDADADASNRDAVWSSETQARNAIERQFRSMTKAATKAGIIRQSRETGIKVVETRDLSELYRGTYSTLIRDSVRTCLGLRGILSNESRPNDGESYDIIKLDITPSAKWVDSACEGGACCTEADENCPEVCVRVKRVFYRMVEDCVSWDRYKINRTRGIVDAAALVFRALSAKLARAIEDATVNGNWQHPSGTADAKCIIGLHAFAAVHGDTQVVDAETEALSTDHFYLLQELVPGDNTAIVMSKRGYSTLKRLLTSYAQIDFCKGATEVGLPIMMFDGSQLVKTDAIGNNLTYGPIAASTPLPAGCDSASGFYPENDAKGKPLVTPTALSGGDDALSSIFILDLDSVGYKWLQDILVTQESNHGCFTAKASADFALVPECVDSVGAIHNVAVADC